MRIVTSFVDVDAARGGLPGDRNFVLALMWMVGSRFMWFDFKYTMVGVGLQYFDKKVRMKPVISSGAGMVNGSRESFLSADLVWVA